jgi:hypothetical protein
MVDAGSAGSHAAEVVRDDAQIIDTPKRDHPDDIDQTAGCQVIVVDGVEVVSTPMNQPIADYIAWLNDHMPDMYPIDLPGPGVPAGTGVGPHPDGPPGFVEPIEPGCEASWRSSDAGLAQGDPLPDQPDPPLRS